MIFFLKVSFLTKIPQSYHSAHFLGWPLNVLKNKKKGKETGLNFIVFHFLKFNPVAPLSKPDPGYNTTPAPDDQVHLLLCVLSANSCEIKDSVLEKMNSIRKMASNLGKRSYHNIFREQELSLILICLITILPNMVWIWLNIQVDV